LCYLYDPIQVDNSKSVHRIFSLSNLVVAALLQQLPPPPLQLRPIFPIVSCETNRPLLLKGIAAGRVENDDDTHASHKADVTLLLENVGTPKR
jgi:hypothetical protein